MLEQLEKFALRYDLSPDLIIALGIGIGIAKNTGTPDPPWFYSSLLHIFKKKFILLLTIKV